jgi:hypothetical protein
MSDEQPHGHEGDGDEVLGMAVGFRIFEDGGNLFLAEAEISPYEDQPDALGVTLVFHALAGIDPTAEAPEDEEPAVFDFDDELTRKEDAPVVEQTQDILRQLAGLSAESLREYLQAAREDANS